MEHLWFEFRLLVAFFGEKDYLLYTFPVESPLRQ